MTRLGRPSRRPSGRTVPAPAQDRLHSGWIALVILMVLAPTLARTPQSGDGAEIVATALRGGVLHPTGFPLQAWCDRLLVRIPGIVPTLALSLFGLIAHAGAGFFVAETLRLLGVTPAGRVLGGAAFALFPSTWTLAVQPEVFSLAHLLIAAVIHAAVRLGMPARSLGPPRAASPLIAAARVGALGSLCAASHPIAVAALPAFAAGAAHALHPGARRGARAMALAAALAIPAAALYLSLPLLRTSSPWPDWGALRTPADVLRHALRMDYGTFAFSAADAAATRSALAAWWSDALGSWNAALVLCAVGALALARRRDLRPALLPIAGTALLGFGILMRGRLPAQTYSDAYLEKLEGPVALAGALLLGLGFQSVRGALPRPGGRRALDAAAMLAAIAWLIAGWPRADASHDLTLDLYARGLAIGLPDSAVYVTEGDVEAFLGTSARRGVRYPVSQPLTSLPWYVREAAPRLEPRVGDVSVEDWGAYLAACFSRRLAVASSSAPLIATSAGVPELRGLLYVARAGATAELTPATVEAAIELVPLAEDLPILPTRGHGFSRFYVRRFARAYAGAAEFLRRQGAARAAARGDSVAAAIDRGGDRALRSRLLREFVTEARRAAGP